MITGLVELYKLAIRFALLLAAIGGLKNATLVMMGRAAHAQQGMISYSKYSKMLTSESSLQRRSQK
jgi:hypothetical protein